MPAPLVPGTRPATSRRPRPQAQCRPVHFSSSRTAASRSTEPTRSGPTPRKDPAAPPISTKGVSRGADDFRAASGLGRWPLSPADLETDGNPAPPRGPGLFQIARANGETAITNIRRLAGAERAPGSRLVLAATVLLGLLAAALFVVTLNAQFKYVFTVKQQAIPSMIEAASLDLGMAIFTLLALGLAMAGQAARIERALIVACAAGSAAQNYAAADVTSPRSVAAYVAPSLFLALVVDRVVAVMRRHVLGDA